ncbi:phage baseplate assembly protein V [Paraburkholderia sp. BR14263]|uniref:phage baseplate assembly protein V n=1 Tax=unclassified Paraburkholderia TaxID=2615204 RepID=UPI0034CF8E2E
MLVIGRGRVSTASDSGPVQLVQVQVNDLETIDNVRRLAEFGFTSMLPDGTDVVMAFIGGDRSNGVIVGSNHQQSRPTGLKAGESMLFSLDGKRVYMTASGGIEIDAKGQPVVINNASDVTWTCTGKFKVIAPGGVEFDTPNLSSTGDITDNTGSGNEESMKSMRTTFDGHDHDINDVQSGGSTLTTQTPNQQE